jgi:antitoxin (DNA-binding transcriptional repressor) of toxin-antitoxin stability system
LETVNISTFKAMCLSLLEKVKQTRQPLLVLKRGEPVAQILPPPPPEPGESWLGSFQSTGEITGDIISPASGENDWEVLNQ